MKLTDIHKLHVSVHMFKIQYSGMGDTMASLVDLVLPDHYHNTRHRGALVPPFPRITAIRRSYKFQFVDIWNQVPDHVKECGSLKCFKRLLSKHLVDAYH